jgi:hypothetical protein
MIPGPRGLFDEKGGPKISCPCPFADVVLYSSSCTVLTHIGKEFPMIYY